MIWFNYFLLLLFAAGAIGWYIAGDWRQGTYYLGAFILNLAVLKT